MRAGQKIRIGHLNTGDLNVRPIFPGHADQGGTALAAILFPTNEFFVGEDVGTWIGKCSDVSFYVK